VSCHDCVGGSLIVWLCFYVSLSLPIVRGGEKTHMTHVACKLRQLVHFCLLTKTRLYIKESRETEEGYEKVMGEY